jgi:hypothetical protein
VMPPSQFLSLTSKICAGALRSSRKKKWEKCVCFRLYKSVMVNGVWLFAVG